MKKLINDPSEVVPESLRGFAAAHSGLVELGPDLTQPYVVRRGGVPAGRVGIVSGGGSGHEPLHIGFVGDGMLDAAVPGPVFTSPTPGPILEATKAVDAGAGVLHIVKNYTGDVLNFEMAAELAEMDGITVEQVIVDDDVAVEDSLYTAGRRGVAGTVLVEKIAGAAARQGRSLTEVAEIAREVIANVRSMGVALTPCTVPAQGVASFELDENEIEIGIGIHGEPGRHRIAMEGANEITDRLLDPILADMHLGMSDRVLLFVNGMGGTPASELYIVYGHARTRLEQAGVEVARSLVGNYTTAIDMHGCSITVLRLSDELTTLWDEPVNTAALRWGM